MSDGTQWIRGSLASWRGRRRVGIDSVAFRQTAAESTEHGKKARAVETTTGKR